ncbi:MAG: molybdate ABC transporter permease subunit, partial [Mycobacterium sp.]
MTRLRPAVRAPLGLPVWIYLPALIGGAFVIAPLAAMLATVQWSQFWELVTSESSVAALKLSLDR